MRLAVAVLSCLLVLSSAATAARLVGTDGPDRLVGTMGSDSIFGRGGSDLIFGLAGNDFLHGGPGRDLLDGGPGDDRIMAAYDGARDTVRCGPGLDVVNADLLDTVAADCELVGRRLSRDPYTNPESQHETEVEPDSLTVGATTVATFQVGRRFDGGADNIGFSVSNDHGRTWRSGYLPGLTAASRPPGPSGRASDPVVAYDAAHATWLIAALALQGTTTSLTVSRSTDGASWATPVVAIEAVNDEDIAFDKEWIVCDNGASSEFFGHCYLAYTDVPGRGSLGVVSSTDGGLTWSAPVRAPATDTVGAFPVVQPSGTLVIPFLWGDRRLGAVTSTDGGASFGAPVLVAEIRARPERGQRLFLLPAADVDPTGRVWVTWHDCGFSAGCSSNSVVVSTTADGLSWSQPARVTRGRNAMLPAIGIHPTTGRVAIAYHAVRNDGGVDVELVESRAGGGWGPPRRLSAQTMRPEWMPNTRSGRMLADYISVHYSAARPLVVWVLASEPVGTSLRQAVYATRG